MTDLRLVKPDLQSYIRDNIALLIRSAKAIHVKRF